MQLTTRQILEFASALVELKGYQQVADGANGRPVSVTVPFDLSPKARWNAGKNLSILKRLAEVHAGLVDDYRKEILEFRKKQDKSADPKANKEALDAEMERVNGLIRTLNGETQEVEGLLKIPAEGLNLKASPISPEIIATLMPLIDGEPKFDDPPPAK